MRVVLQGIERLGPIKQQRVRETVARLAREYPVDAKGQLTIRFCARSEYVREWAGVPADIPAFGFYNITPAVAYIDVRASSDRAIRGIAGAWYYSRLSFEGRLDPREQHFPAVKDFAKGVADRVLGRGEEAA